MVAGRGSGRPQRGHGGEPAGDRIPVEPQLRIDGIDEGGQAVLVRQALLDGDPGLSGGGELRPDVRDALAVGEPALAHQPGHHQGGDRLGGREHRRQGVRAERAGHGAVGEARHQVDHHLAVEGGAEPRAQLPALGEIGGEGVADGREPPVADAADLHRRHQARRSMRTLGDADLILEPMATSGSSGEFHMPAAATVSATPPTALARA